MESESSISKLDLNKKLELAKKILTQSKNPEFRDFVRESAGKKFDGDVNFLLADFSSKQTKSRLSIAPDFLNLISENQNSENGLQIYLPFFLDNSNKRTFSSDSEIIIVFQETDESIKEIDGYVLVGEELVKLNYKISEETAKSQEVWVIGYNERIGDSNFISIDREKTRTVGAGEYIYQIQVPDLSEIEHWTAGAIELTARVATQKSGDALVYYYGDISRSDLKDGKWKTLNTFIANWTTTSVGDYIKVHWTERDGGVGSVKITLTMPSSENVPYETKVEFTITGDDDNLGHQMVQFTDLITQIYSTGFISWKMNSL